MNKEMKIKFLKFNLKQNKKRLAFLQENLKNLNHDWYQKGVHMITATEAEIKAITMEKTYEKFV